MRERCALHRRFPWIHSIPYKSHQSQVLGTLCLLTYITIYIYIQYVYIYIWTFSDILSCIIVLLKAGEVTSQQTQHVLDIVSIYLESTSYHASFMQSFHSAHPAEHGRRHLCAAAGLRKVSSYLFWASDMRTSTSFHSTNWSYGPTNFLNFLGFRICR